MRSGKIGLTGFATSQTRVTYQTVPGNGVFAHRRKPLTPLQPTCKSPSNGDPASPSNGDSALHPMETPPLHPMETRTLHPMETPPLYPMETQLSIQWRLDHRFYGLGMAVPAHYGSAGCLTPPFILYSSVECLTQRRRETESAEKSQKSERKERYDKKRPKNFFHPIGENNYDAN